MGHKMANYLIRRGARYSYRRRYPTDVAAVLGRTEFVQALGTSDPVEAARLSRRVSVEFDDACAEALAKAGGSPLLSPEKQGNEPTTTRHSDVASDVIASLPEVIRTVTQLIISEQQRNPRGWRDEVAWRKKALKGHINGEMPSEIQMHPLKAIAALKAIEAIETGQPMHAPEQRLNPPEDTESVEFRGGMQHRNESLLSKKQLEVAFTEYSQGKSRRRMLVARRCVSKCLTLPCNEAEARASITSWCSTELIRGKKPSAVWTEVSAVVALLKFVPGWDSFRLPKIGEIRALKGAGKARKDARHPMPVPILKDVIHELPSHLPRSGEHWHAALLLCALYGFRPGELLQSGPQSLIERVDIMGKSRLVFRVGVDGAKNESSKRDVPVPDYLEPVFRLALRQGACIPETTRTRVQRLNRIVRQTLGTKHPELSLYSVRHTFTDVGRACGYSDEELGPLLGHVSKATITSIYGGKAPLDKQAEILLSVQNKLFPEGLAGYLQPLNVTSV